jgi:uncharacterized membrane protein YedE/YeeE
MTLGPPPSPRPFWPPLAAGVALGLVLLLTFVVTGHGLGASGFFTELGAFVAGSVAPEATAANTYLGPYLEGPAFRGWISWEIVGLFAGALAGSLASGRFRPGVERGAGVAVGQRLGWALAGGILVGFGSRLARGCTSGLGLSGGATLSVAAFVFLIAFFAAGFAAMALVRRYWR